MNYTLWNAVPIIRRRPYRQPWRSPVCDMRVYEGFHTMTGVWKRYITKFYY